jgi:AcrR family transcriptional regulator
VRAILELSGQVGYNNVTVAAIVERSGSNRAHFYATFGGKGEAYGIAYSEVVGELLERLLRACARDDWRSAMKAGLGELARFADEDPELAAGLIAEVHVAGGAALVVRSEAVERLSRAIDRARREVPNARQSPPPITSRFIVAAIESTVIRTVLERGSLTVELPELLYLVIFYYFGPEAARREVEDLS